MKRHALCLNYVDWLADTRVRCCTAEERGVWIEVLMYMNQAERRGVLERKLEQIARLVGTETSVLHSLIRQGLLKGQDGRGDYGPEGAGNRLPLMGIVEQGPQRGQQVIVLEEPEGPMWFCDWMVAETYSVTVGAEAQLPVVAKPEATLVKSPPEGEGVVSWESKEGTPAKQGGELFELTPSGSAEDEEDSGQGGGRKIPNCPHARLVELFQRMLPTAKKVVVVGPGNELGKALKARWRSLAAAEEGEFTGYTCVEDGLKKWAAIFAMAGRSKFLTGRVPNRNGEAPFELSLLWMVGPKNMEKLLNGFYNRDAGERGVAAGDQAPRSAMAERVLSGVEQVMAMQRRMTEGAPEARSQESQQLEALPL